VKHVVFGTGAVGSTLIEHLAAAGEQVVAVNRRGHAVVQQGVEVVGGDASDSEFSTRVLQGASVAYQCLNPPYTKWLELFPALQAGVLDGAIATGAKLVSFENLYMYGPTAAMPLTEDSPSAATGKKGKVRAQMARDLLAVHEAGRVRVAIGRASDYFGPRAVTSAMGDRVFARILSGKRPQVMGNPDQLHTYSYVPDIAAGLAILGRDRRADGEAWHLPNASAVTPREFIAKICDITGTSLTPSVLSRAMVTAVGLFNGTVRELKEMLYEFEEPYVVDSGRFESTFDVHATPLDVAIPATVDWYRSSSSERA
jgi:nucleoside-diphosphate-sugar epimerase